MKWEAQLSCGCSASGVSPKIPELGDDYICTVHGAVTLVNKVWGRSI